MDLTEEEKTWLLQQVSDTNEYTKIAYTRLMEMERKLASIEDLVRRVLRDLP